MKVVTIDPSFADGYFYLGKVFEAQIQIKLENLVETV